MYFIRPSARGRVLPHFLRPFLIGVTFALGLAQSGCAEKAKLGGRTLAGVAPVLVTHVQKKPMPLTIDAVGAVEPIHTTSVRAQVTGTLLKLGFAEGQDVVEGAVLFEIDPRPFRNALGSAEADQQRIRVQLENARVQLARYATLINSAMISKEQYQNVEATERVLTAQLVVADNAVANARLQLEYCSIRAPIGGRTGNLGVHVGDLIRANDATTSLITINQVSPIYVTFGLPQRDLPSLTHYSELGTVTVTAAPTGAPEISETGELTFIDNAVDTASGALKLKATFPNTARHLWPGQFVATRVTLANPEVLVLPTAAVQPDQKGHHVFVVKADKTAELRAVVIERSDENEAVIARGVTEGETVITDGQIRVVPGKPVDVKEPVTVASAPGAKKKGKKPQ